MRRRLITSAPAVMSGPLSFGMSGAISGLQGASASSFANGQVAPPGYRWDFVTDASRNNERVTDASRNNEPVVALVGA